MHIDMLRDLGVASSVLAAPMAGGPSTPALVIEAARAGSLGFLAGGYKSPDDLAVQFTDVAAAGVPFGVNLFAPNTVAITPAHYRAYVDALTTDAERYGVDLRGIPLTEDDDSWDDKIGAVLATRPAILTTTFGVPPARSVAALHSAGIPFGMTVTSSAEARVARDAGADLLIVQGTGAGGHSGTITPERPVAERSLPSLVAEVAGAIELPIIAAGGIGTRADAAAALTAGAGAVAVGTALLLSEEAGTSITHRAALTDSRFTRTVFTRSFTGRPARALANRWTDEHDEEAPLGYPAIHHLTSGLRRAAAAAEDPDGVHLWAGVGWQTSRSGRAGDILAQLAP